MEIPEQFKNLNEELKEENKKVEEELQQLHLNDQQNNQENIQNVTNGCNKLYLNQKEDDQPKVKSKEQTEQFKNQGNEFYYKDDTNEALNQYEMAIDYCPEEETKLMSIIYYNMALCYYKHNDLESVISYCTRSIKLNEKYVKPLKKRAEAFEKLEKYEECLEDLKKIKELDPDDKEILYKLPRIEQKYNAEFEKKKNEAIDGLKTLANKALNYFGMDINNFKLQQNENGSYNIAYQNQ